MQSSDGVARSFELLALAGVESLNRELGRGSYGRVFAVKYCGMTCAAKEVHSDLMQGQRIVDMFLRECDHCSRLRHPNIVQFLGVYYPAEAATTIRIPVMVMEMMAGNLTSFLENQQNIPVHQKFSIINDVALGLFFLHSQNPPVIHRDLSSNNILLTDHNVAKIGDLGVAKVVQAGGKKTTAPGTIDFMPPEALYSGKEYDTPLDIFSFAAVILHTFTQQWPSPSQPNIFDPKTRERVALSEVERRSKYLKLMTGEGEALRPLIEKCLDEDPAVRPSMEKICKEIQLMRNVEQVTGKLERTTLGSRATVKKSKIKNEALPLAPALTSGRYRIKWTQLAGLPVPLYCPYVTVQDQMMYVAGHASAVAEVREQVYAYDISVDQWRQLPTPGQYYGIPHIIGGKLSIIGGRLSNTRKRTNRVLTFDEVNNTWISHHPNLLSAVSKPGVVTHLEYVIVAGGAIGNDNNPVAIDEIGVLNWVENSNWIKVSTRLPVPMFNIKPIISDGNLLFVEYYQSKFQITAAGYKIPVAAITSSVAQHATWTKMIPASHLDTAIVPNSSPLLVIGGHVASPEDTTTDVMLKKYDSSANIEMYDDSSKSWKKIDSLSNSRTGAGVAAIGNNAIVVIGGSTDANNATSSAVATVELGQAELSS